MKSYYEILNVEENATKQQIKSQYHKLVRMYHPDVNSSLEAEKIFKDVNRAAEILLDDEKRKKYDLLRQSAKNQFKKEPFQTKTKYNYNNKTKFEYKEEQKPLPLRGDDIELNITITFQEAIFGCLRVVNIAHSEICPKCKGHRFSSSICQECGGRGEIETNRKITVKIPPSVKNKTRLRIKNEGKQGKFGGENGNLYITVNVEQNDELNIIDNTVYVKSYISPYTAVLGGDIDVATLWGKTTIKIPPLTKSNQSFKIMDVGIFDEKTGKKGDEIVSVIIQIPSNITNEEIFLYERLKDISLKKKNAAI